MSARLFLITGSPGAGKTTLSHALLQRFPLGVRISVDDIREQVVSGREDPNRAWTDGMQLQFDTAREAAAAMAAVYVRNGFSVVIDDHIRHDAAELLLERTGHPTPGRVFLCPPVEVVIERNRTRTNKNLTPEMAKELAEWIPGLHAVAIEQYGDRSKWLSLDSSRPLDELVDAILKS